MPVLGQVEVILESPRLEEAPPTRKATEGQAQVGFRVKEAGQGARFSVVLPEEISVSLMTFQNSSIRR